jgi:ribosomal protein S18 acetylase RimI-like enzyme
MNIRSFKPQDIKQVVNLANSYASFDSEVTEVFFDSASSFPKGLLIAEDGGIMGGFIYAYRREVPLEVLKRWAATKVAQIELLAVDPSYRSQGIGNALLERLIEILRGEGVDLILLNCPVEAKEARHLYDKFGFEVRAYAMKKRL